MGKRAKITKALKDEVITQHTLYHKTDTEIAVQLDLHINTVRKITARYWKDKMAKKKCRRSVLKIYCTTVRTIGI